MVDRSVHLRELQISKRKLRFLEWASSDQTDSISQTSPDGIPLFLGADVLSGCSIAVSNLPRMHAKFSKQGLAVKVNFPTPMRLQGVHGSARGVWFYSIQGLLECVSSITAAKSNWNAWHSFVSHGSKDFQTRPYIEKYTSTFRVVILDV